MPIDGETPLKKDGKSLVFNELLEAEKGKENGNGQSNITPLRKIFSSKEEQLRRNLRMNEREKSFEEMKERVKKVENELESFKRQSEEREIAHKEKVELLEAQIASLMDMVNIIRQEQKDRPKEQQVQKKGTKQIVTAQNAQPTSNGLTDKKKETTSIEIEQPVQATSSQTGMVGKSEGEWIRVVNNGNKKSLKKMEKQVKYTIVGPKPPAPISVVYMRWHMPRHIKSHEHKKKFAWANKVLKTIKVKDMVKEKSFIGNAIMALYVETDKLEELKNTIMKWAETEEDVFVTQKEINEYSCEWSVSSEIAKQKEINRVTILCARNQGQFMQECLLANIDTSKHESIKMAAAELRAKWRKGDNKDSDKDNNNEA